MISPIGQTRHFAVDPGASRRSGQVTLAHGGGGQLTDELVRDLILPRLGNAVLNDLLDAAITGPVSGRVALTIDGYVVRPLRFPGGDIGRLAVCGTVNDLAVCGAVPAGLALGLVIEEGLERALLEELLESVNAAAKEAGVCVVTGDTKVVGRGHADGLYVTTAGVGVVPAKSGRLHPNEVCAGDLILINGPIADHGLAVMLAREMPDVRTTVRSDVAPLNHMIRGLLDEVPGVAFLRDPTRAGLAGVAADLAERTGWDVELEEAEIPVRPETRHAAEMLGLDPLEVANEGKVVVIVRPDAAEAALRVMRRDPLGAYAKVIGRVTDRRDSICELRTEIGGRRVLRKPYGEQLPRIC